ncbi:MAG: EAL domain-containing protein [Thalassotalea sp.]
MSVALVFTLVLLACYLLSRQNNLADNVFIFYQHPIVNTSLHNILQVGVLAPDLKSISIANQLITVNDSAFFTRQVMADNNSDFIVFTHPIQAVFTAPVTWFFLALYLVLMTFLRKRVKACVAEQLAEVRSLEHWITSSQQQNQTQPLTPNSHITDYISAMQAELLKAQRGKSRFDQELKENALLDPATRIGNRNFFTSHLEAFLKEEDCRGAVFLIQLKGCELLQNLYGEEQALKLLETVIDNIKQRIAPIPDCFLSRQGEFELAVLAPSLFVNDAEKLAERLLKNLTTLALPIGVNKDEFCHIGISYFKSDNNAFQIMSEADMALRSAQLQGPSQWFMYDPGEVAKETAIGSLQWRTFLSQVIVKKSFIIFSQPVIASKENKVLHYEVLSRVSNNKGELISPRIFLPMAEKCGLANPLDLIIFEQVCQLITFEDKNDAYSLNFSIDAILSEDFRDKLFDILTRYPNVAAKLVIEISEYQIKSRLNELIPIVNTLKAKGFRILVDKVGQYVINTQYLKQCQISSVKLHRSIVLDIHLKPENQVFVQSMKVLCDSLDIDLYAVGVESLDEWRTLMQIGVCGGQGHYFNEPVAQLANSLD